MSPGHYTGWHPQERAARFPQPGGSGGRRIGRKLRDFFQSQFVWQPDPQEYVVLRQQFDREIEMNQNLEDSQRRMFGKVDDGVAGLVPAPPVRSRTLTRQIRIRSAAEPPRL